MTLDLLRAHPDLVTEVTPDAHRVCCDEIVTRYGSWYCGRLARWQVRGHPVACGQHAARTLRRELQADLDAGAGS